MPRVTLNTKNNSTSPESIIPLLSSPTVRKSSSDVNTELTGISSNSKQEETKFEELWRKWKNGIIEKCTIRSISSKQFDAALQNIPKSSGTIKSNEMRQLANGDLDESTYVSQPTRFHGSPLFDRVVDKSYFSLKKTAPTNPKLLNDYLEENNSKGIFFDVSLKPVPRRQILPRKMSRLYRIPFHNRLEPVLEQSQGFSYLFPAEDK